MMPTPHQLVDLSVTLGPNASEPLPIALHPISHQEGGDHLSELVGMDACCGRGWASERIEAVTHAGTHVDAPYHYAPRAGGRPARTIDELPLEWFSGPGVCVRVPGERDRLIGIDEVCEQERAWGEPIAPGTIVLFDTGAAAAWGDPAYTRCGRALSPDLVRWILDRGVRVIGTDAWSIDPWFDVMREHVRTGRVDEPWAAHLVGREREFCIVEKLANLSALPDRGFWVTCFPIKVHRASAGWVRPVAFVPQAHEEIVHVA